MDGERARLQPDGHLLAELFGNGIFQALYNASGRIAVGFGFALKPRFCE